MPEQTIIEAEEQLAFTPPQDELSEFITEIRGRIERETDARQLVFNRWRGDYNMYRGLIGRPYPDIPFEGSSDLRYRIGAMAIRKTRPMFVNTICKAPKVVRLTPIAEGPEAMAANTSADRLEAFYELEYRGRMKEFRKLVASLYTQEGIYGRCIAKPTWCLRTELRTILEPRSKFVDAINKGQALKYKAIIAQANKAQRAITDADADKAKLTDEEIKKGIAAILGWEFEGIYLKRIDSIFKQLNDDGSDEIEVVKDVVVENQPKISMVGLEDLILPGDSANVETAEWIVHKLRMSRRQLISKSDRNGGPYRNVDEILDLVKWAPLGLEQRQMDRDKRKAEGLTDVPTGKEKLNVWELYCWVDRNWIKRFNGLTEDETDVKVRAVITFCPEIGTDLPFLPLRVIEYPYQHNAWPFLQCDYNYSEDRFYSGEGIIDILWPIEMEYNMSRNAAINKTTITMQPPIFYDEDSGFEPNTHRQFPQYHAITSRAFQADQGQPARAMQFPDLASAANFDATNAKEWADDWAGIQSVQSLQGYNSAPTAEHVQQTVAGPQLIQDYELENFKDFWSRIFTQVHSLEKQYRFMDADTKEITFVNKENKQPVKLTRQDFEFDYLITSGGDASSQQSVLADQKRFAVMQMTLNTPFVAPFVDIYDAWTQFVNHMLNYSEANAFIPDKSKAQEMQQKFMEMQAQAAVMQAQGKRKRNPKTMQLQTAKTGMVPK